MNRALKWQRRFILWGGSCMAGWLLANGYYVQGICLALIGTAFDLWITSV